MFSAVSPHNLRDLMAENTIGVIASATERPVASAVSMHSMPSSGASPSTIALALLSVSLFCVSFVHITDFRIYANICSSVFGHSVSVTYWLLLCVGSKPCDQCLDPLVLPANHVPLFVVTSRDKQPLEESCL